MPIAANQRALGPQQVQRRLVLLFIQFIGILDAEFWFFLHQEQGRIGDVDGAIKRLDPALVGFAIGQVLLFKHHVPALWRFLENIGVVGQHICPPLIGRSIVNAINSVPRRFLQALVNGFPGWNEVNIDGLNALAGNEAQRGIT